MSNNQNVPSNEYLNKVIPLYDFMNTKIAKELDVKIFDDYDEKNIHMSATSNIMSNVVNKFSFDISAVDNVPYNGNNGLFKLTVYDRGFESTDPIVMGIKEKGLTVTELEEILKDFVEEKNLEKRTNILSKADFENLNEAEFVGCRNVKLLSNNNYYDGTVCEVQDEFQLYFKKNSEFMMIEARTDYGMCGSGYTSASWGQFELYNIKELPEEFAYTISAENNVVTAIRELEVFNDDSCGEFEQDRIYVSVGGEELLNGDFIGGDPLYPMGRVFFNDEHPDLIENTSYKYNLDIYGDPEFNLEEYNREVYGFSLEEENENDNNYNEQSNDFSNYGI